MIKHLQGGPGVTISGGMNNMPFINTSMLSSGQLRYNGSTQNIEVYDGTQWLNMSSSAPIVQLDPRAIRVLDWAEKKMNEEEDLERRMKDHPGLQDAYEQFKVMDAMTKDKISEGTYRRA